MRETFKTLINDFIKRDLAVKDRGYTIATNTQKIVSLIGIRRSGKTYLLFQLINKLRESISRENIVYINFEDDRLAGINLVHLDDFIEAYYELFPHKRKERVHLLLDEVHVVEEWERFVRRIHDSLNVQVYVTGSSSRLMSKEIASSLRGRTISYEVFPLSFREFLDFRGVEIDLYSSESCSFIKNALDLYLKFGGFPEVVLDDDEVIKRRILSDYSALMIYKDIADRYELKNLTLLKFIVRYSFKNPATLMSYGKLYNTLKSMGYRLSKETLIDYFGYLEDIFALHLIPIYRWSLKEQMRNPKKLFIVDNGFKTIHSLDTQVDYSKLYENVVFGHLRRKYREIFYFSEGKEIDFYVPDGQLLINVCYDLSSQDTLNREIRSIKEGLEKLGIQEAHIITNQQEEELAIDGFKINMIPLWKWLLKC